MLAQNLDSIQQRAGLSGLPDTLGGLISNVLPWVFGIAGFLLLIYMILGGLQMMTSRGDPKAIQAAQAKITNALIGFVVILLSAGIVVLIGNLLNIDILKEVFGSKTSVETLTK